MSRITHIDIPSADSAITSLANLVTEFEQAVGEIKRVAADLHGCWGNDDTGKAFAANYVDQAEQVLQGSGDSVASLRQVEQYLRDAVRQFQELDGSSGQFLEYKD